MIIPGVLASRVRDKGAGWLLGSTSVLSISQNTRIDAESQVKALSVQYVRKLLPAQHMSRTHVKAASVQYVRKMTRIMPMPLMKTASAMIVSKRDREPPTIKVKAASLLLITKRPPGAPNPLLKTSHVLVISQMEAA